MRGGRRYALGHHATIEGGSAEAVFSVAAAVLCGRWRGEAGSQADNHEREAVARGKKQNAGPTHRYHRNTRPLPCHTPARPAGAMVPLGHGPVRKPMCEALWRLRGECGGDREVAAVSTNGGPILALSRVIVDEPYC